MINKKTYRGQIEPLSVFNALCSAFSDPPKKCLKTLGKEQQANLNTLLTEEAAEDLVTVTEILGLVFVLILVNAVVVYCCRRKARREMQNTMNM